MEVIAGKKDVGVVPVPVLGHSLSALGVALSGLRRGGEAPWSDVHRNCRWRLRAAVANRLHILETLGSIWAEGEPDRATEHASIVENISRLATLTEV